MTADLTRGAAARPRAWVRLALLAPLGAAGLGLGATTAAKPSPAAAKPSLAPDFWPINLDYPGVRPLRPAGAGAPHVYAVDDLLDPATCAALVAKASPHMARSRVDAGGAAGAGAGAYGTSDALRTSADVRVAFDETPNVQATFSELLAMPVAHFEPLKVSWYAGARGDGAAGGHFAPHDDAALLGYPDGCVDCPTPRCNRVVTLLVCATRRARDAPRARRAEEKPRTRPSRRLSSPLPLAPLRRYLNDCAEGGATRFNALGLDVRPTRGMGLVFFPAFLDTATNAGLRGRCDPRVRHEGAPAVDEKFICQQWGWTGPIIRERLDAGYRAHGRCDDTVL